MIRKLGRQRGLGGPRLVFITVRLGAKQSAGSHPIDGALGPGAGQGKAVGGDSVTRPAAHAVFADIGMIRT